MSSAFDAFADLVRSRRTNMRVDGERTVPAEVIDRLCELARWAPNHKHTFPYRFASLTGNARLRLGEAFADDMEERQFGDDVKRAKTRTKFGRTPNILAAASAPNDNPTIDQENRYAVAAAVQMVLLGATAEGVATYWSTPPLHDSPRALEVCKFEPHDRFVGIIYVGYPVATLPTPERPTIDVNHIA
ncbi:MAG TPA: nitroreductase [Ilumatobacter sp.]|jgi:nitroreductase|nr:nitroreductase [Ilumatobacter sp.]